MLSMKNLLFERMTMEKFHKHSMIEDKGHCLHWKNDKGKKIPNLSSSHKIFIVRKGHDCTKKKNS